MFLSFVVRQLVFKHLFGFRFRLLDSLHENVTNLRVWYHQPYGIEDGLKI